MVGIARMGGDCGCVGGASADHELDRYIEHRRLLATFESGNEDAVGDTVRIQQADRGCDSQGHLHAGVDRAAGG